MAWNLISQRSIRSSEGVHPMEVEPNQFAACSLMSSRLMRAAAAESEGPLHDDDVQELAEAFGVSEQAMAIRLSTLRLL
jgi:Zn-dependent peptidase ImmA (M78 family)